MCILQQDTLGKLHCELTSQLDVRIWFVLGFIQVPLRLSIVLLNGLQRQKQHLESILESLKGQQQ